MKEGLQGVSPTEAGEQHRNTPATEEEPPSLSLFHICRVGVHSTALRLWRSAQRGMLREQTPVLPHLGGLPTGPGPLRIGCVSLLQHLLLTYGF